MGTLLGGFRSVTRKFAANKLSSNIDTVSNGGAGISMRHFGLIRGKVRHFCSCPKGGDNGADIATKGRLLEYIRTFDYQQGLKKIMIHDGLFTEKMGRYCSVGGAMCTVYIAIWSSEYVLTLLGKESGSEIGDQLLESAQEMRKDKETIEKAVSILGKWVDISNKKMSMESKRYMIGGAAKLVDFIKSYPDEESSWKTEMLFKLDSILAFDVDLD